MTDTFEPILGGPAPTPSNGDNGGQGTPADNSDGGQIADGGNPLLQSGETGNQPNNSFLESLTPENRKIAEASGWKDPNDAFKSYGELRTKMSQGLQPEAGEDGNISPEQWHEFGKRVGAPEKAEFYEFQRPDVPDYVTYNDELENHFRNVLHKYKNNKAQASGIYSEMTQFLVKEQESHRKHIQDGISNTMHMAEREFGGKDSPVYREAMNQAFQSIKATPGLLEAYTQAGVLVKAPSGGYHVTNPAILFHHANSGSALQTESEGFSGLNGESDSKNPFTDQHENITAQGQIIAKDRQTAIRLIRAAGKDPSEFGV